MAAGGAKLHLVATQWKSVKGSMQKFVARRTNDCRGDKATVETKAIKVRS